MMTMCGRCINQYGYDHEKVANIHVVATDKIEGTVYWFGICDECGGWTDPCLTPTEARARISKGLYNRKADTLGESAERTCYDDAGCCSECGNRIGQVAYGDGIRMEPKYCPHCGARIERKK